MPRTDLVVELIGQDGNAFFLIGRVRKELARAEELELAEEFVREAFSASSYDELLSVIEEYVIVE